MTGFNPPAAKRPQRKRRSSLGLVVVVFIIIIGALLALFLGRLSFLGEFLPSTSGVLANNQDAQISTVVTYNMREPLEVVLNSGGDNRVYLRLELSLKLGRAQDVPFVKNLEPAIRDTIIPFLQELRPNELQGSRGVFLLREEMLFRINKITSSVRVDDVYITEMQLQ